MFSKNELTKVLYPISDKLMKSLKNDWFEKSQKNRYGNMWEIWIEFIKEILMESLRQWGKS